MNVAVPPLPSAFPDTDQNPYKSDIAYDAARQILSGPTDWKGRPTGFFLPKGTLNRAEAAKILYLSLHAADLNAAQALYPADIRVIADNFMFTPSVITVNRGQPVTINFKVSGRHTFSIDGLHLYKALVNRTETLSFTPNIRGTFLIRCETQGHAGMGMTGALIVR
mgnify:FL=1